MLNNRTTGRGIRKDCELDANCEGILQQAVSQLGLSAPMHDVVLKVARTIADLADADHIGPGHLSEAIHYRWLDWKL